MKFENAYKGIKKIFTAEILNIIAVVLGIFTALIGIITIAMAANPEITENSVVWTTIVTIILGVAAGIIGLIAFIFNIVGIVKASKDEQGFKTAAIFVFVSIISTIVGTILVANPIWTSIFARVSQVAQLITIIMVIKGIMNISSQYQNNYMIEKGRTLIILTFVLHVLMIGSAIASTALIGAGTIPYVLSLAASFAGIVQYIFYLVYLKNSMKMIESASKQEN